MGNDKIKLGSNKISKTLIGRIFNKTKKEVKEDLSWIKCQK
jgi:hypothetical protein